MGEKNKAQPLYLLPGLGARHEQQTHMLLYSTGSGAPEPTLAHPCARPERRTHTCPLPTGSRALAGV